MAETKTGLLDVLGGDKSFKLEIGIDWQSVGMLAASVFVVGIVLIIISKQIKGK